jgi:hypothetical protein
VIKSAGKLSYDEVDAVLNGDGQVQLQGATVEDIKTLNVSIYQDTRRELTLMLSVRRSEV